MIHRPDLLLADEPTGNLHSAQATEIMELFQKLNSEGTTVIQVSHSEVNAAYGSSHHRAARRMDLLSDTAGVVRNGGGDGLNIRSKLALRPDRSSPHRQRSRPKPRPVPRPPRSGGSRAAGSTKPGRPECRRSQREERHHPERRDGCPACAPPRYSALLQPLRALPCLARRTTPNLANSPRIDQLVQNGELVLSLKDAIALALENNLDLAIARYNIPIAQADILRTQAGGSFRGVNTGVVQNTPGGGVGGFGSGSSGAGAGGTSGGAGGAGSGASGLVQSTLGTGTNVNSYDPVITASINTEHDTEPLSNTSIYGVQSLQLNTITGNFGYSQAFPTGTTLSAIFDNNRQATNSPFSILNPTLNSNYRFLLQQQLLAGFGLGPNLRFLRIAKNNQKISDEAFKLQVITTITQIANMYWDLVAAYEDNQVKARSLTFAQETLDKGRKQLELQAIPAMDVLKDEGEVATREQDVSIAKSTLQFQELLIKNALTKNLDDPILEAMPVRPTDRIGEGQGEGQASGPTEDLIARALRDRIELSESGIDLENRRISRDAARNALLPQVALTGYYAGHRPRRRPEPRRRRHLHLAVRLRRSPPHHLQQQRALTTTSASR